MISGKMNLRRWLRKSVVGLSVVAVMVSFSLANTCFAVDYNWIKLFPEHVGVFTTVGEQQFVAFGYKNDGTRENITKKVDWISSNEDIVTINASGLATVVTGKTAGQVKITCSYPKTGGGSGNGPAVNLLLLK